MSADKRTFSAADVDNYAEELLNRGKRQCTSDVAALVATVPGSTLAEGYLGRLKPDMACMIGRFGRSNAFTLLLEQLDDIVTTKMIESLQPCERGALFVYAHDTGRLGARLSWLAELGPIDHPDAPEREKILCELIKWAQNDIPCPLARTSVFLQREHIKFNYSCTQLLRKAASLDAFKAIRCILAVRPHVATWAYRSKSPSFDGYTNFLSALIRWGNTSVVAFCLEQGLCKNEAAANCATELQIVISWLCSVDKPNDVLHGVRCVALLLEHNSNLHLRGIRYHKPPLRKNNCIIQYDDKSELGDYVVAICDHYNKWPAQHEGWISKSDDHKGYPVIRLWLPTIRRVATEWKASRACDRVLLATVDDEQKTPTKAATSKPLIRF